MIIKKELIHMPSEAQKERRESSTEKVLEKIVSETSQIWEKI